MNEEARRSDQRRLLGDLGTRVTECDFDHRPQDMGSRSELLDLGLDEPIWHGIRREYAAGTVLHQESQRGSEQSTRDEAFAGERPQQCTDARHRKEAITEMRGSSPGT